MRLIQILYFRYVNHSVFGVQHNIFWANPRKACHFFIHQQLLIVWVKFLSNALQVSYLNFDWVYAVYLRT